MIVLNAPTATEMSEVIAFSGKLGATYDPSAAAIQSVDFSIDTIDLSSGGHRVGVAAKQNGELFYDFEPPLFATDSAWLSDRMQTSLTAQNFMTVPGASHPDFSKAGAPIEFGFFNAVSSPAGSTAGTTVVGLDNWYVTLNTSPGPGVIPLPAPFALGIVGMACAAVAQKRRAWLAGA